MKLPSTLLLSALLCACDPQPYDSTASPPPQRPPSKTIIAKESPVEQRMGFDFFSRDHFRQRTVTIYYLIAEDGTAAEVPLGEWAKTKVGDNYATFGWSAR